MAGFARMGPHLVGLADLARETLPGPREGEPPEGRGGRRSASADELRDVPAELSALLRDLASAPETPVDVASGWTPGLVPGDVVGRFMLLRELGRGGFGVVYEALDREVGRAVAFKAVRPGLRLSRQSEEWLRAEAEALGRLSHTNIVTLHDFGRGPCGPYLIFELLKGRTLADRLLGGALSLPEAVAIAVDVARALAHAHRAGVVHRDLEPANVFLGDDGTVKVLDFGLAYLFGRGGPVTGGTPAYMAPEQWRCSPGDERTDLFALGALLHRMISGEVPYRAVRDRSEALDPGRPPRLSGSAAPAPLRGLVAQMLERDPDARPRSAQAVLDELLAAQRLLARPRGARRGLWAAAIAVASLAIAAALVL